MPLYNNNCMPELELELCTERAIDTRYCAVAALQTAADPQPRR